jgi:branched-chain amino acid transport system permease protein
VPILATSAEFWGSIFNAVSLGSIAALAALGFLLTYKATGVVNFAQGDMITLGAYLGLWAVKDLDLDTIPAYLVAIAAMFVIGVVLERICYAPLRGRSVHVVVIATLGAAFIIRGLLLIWRGSELQTLPSPSTGHWKVFGATLTHQRVIIWSVTAVVVIGMMYLFNRTSFGRQVRALASDRETAQLHGVPVARMSMLSFGLSAALAGAAGVLVAPLNGFETTLGFGLMLGGFAAAILGGFGSLGGVVIGGFLIGFAENFVGYYWFRDYKSLYPYVLMLGVIALRPQGLFTRGAHGRL